MSRAAKGADCKSAGYAFAGSSPASPTTSFKFLKLIDFYCGSAGPRRSFAGFCGSLPEIIPPEADRSLASERLRRSDGAFNRSGEMMRLLTRLAALAFALPLVQASAAEITVLSGNGGRPVVIELSGRFEKETGHKVNIDFAVNPQVRKRVLDGEAFDVTVLNPPVLDELIKAGKVKADTRTVIGRIGIGVGIKQGAPRPDLSSAEGFKKALLAAKKVAYPEEGASGIYFANLVKRLGIEEEMKSRLMPMPGEYNVEVVADGAADMVVVVASRIYGVKGVDMVGLLPDELQTWIGFAAGVSAGAKDPDLALKLVKALAAPSAEPFMRQVGLQPFVE